MDCPSCHHSNLPEALYCGKCGAQLEWRCPQCQKPLPCDIQFCIYCGHVLSEPATSSETSAQAETAKPSADPGGERRQATIAFSDLSGYTAMNERLDPEEVEGLMSRIKQIAV
jgi:hypothetical protein